MPATSTEQLKADLKTVTRELEEISQVIDGLQTQKRQLEGRAKMLRNNLAQRPKEIRITDHAILRYGERMLGWDVDAVRKDLEETFKGTDFVSLKAHGFVVKDRVLVTVLPGGQE